MKKDNCLITGANGFFGKIISNSLEVQNSYNITGLSRTETLGVKADLAKPFTFPTTTQVDILIHAAGKAHVVPKTPKEVKEFLDINLMGTQNLCNSLESLSELPKSMVFISTVAVYGVTDGELIPESHPLNGDNPYAVSKILAEEWLKDWAKKNNVTLGILRMPLIAGPSAPGNLGAMINGIQKGRYFGIGDSSARKSVVWAADVADIIPKLSDIGGVYNLTDNYHPSFYELQEVIAEALMKKSPKNLPLPIAKTIAKIGDYLGNRAPVNTSKLDKMLATLTFDDSKAFTELNWRPSRVLDKLPTVL
ncbi:NAD-dependent epimerase/dehydratase family protein [Litoribacter ruber]|uniref:NAD-dependent epimerase/dehydratase family protein n=1 Tax=Litoribacter ruber TaxID=702568 RepID=UPI001BDAB4FC|nr:NAD-dependent epimerase/dehydratase family protein [Litoribacter ruber]MBT0812913.1 NAD-dependent epimerase/dehydratase family protein [Litoribacter ruber]